MFLFFNVLHEKSQITRNTTHAKQFQFNHYFMQNKRNKQHNIYFLQTWTLRILKAQVLLITRQLTQATIKIGGTNNCIVLGLK